MLPISSGVALLRGIIAKRHSRSFRARLAKGFVGTFIARGLGMGIQLLLELVLTRTLGAAGFGIYAYVRACVRLAALFSQLGLGVASLRFIAAYNAQQEWALAKGHAAFAQRWVLVAGMSAALLGMLAFWLVGDRLEAGLRHTFYVGVWLIPLLALLILRSAIARALGWVVAALVPDLFVRPIAVLLIIGSAVLLFGLTFSPAQAMGAAVVGAVLGLGVTSFLLARARPEAWRIVQSEERPREWLNTAAPLLLLAGMQNVLGSAGVLMLGWLIGTTEVGVYAVAANLAGLTSFSLGTINHVFAPTIAELYARGDRATLQKVVTMTGWWAMAGALVISVPMFAFAGFWLSWFGEAFTDGDKALRVLLLGGLVHASTGSIGYLMTMTGQERQALLLVGGAAVVNVALNAVLIPRFGIEGAAIASAMAVAGWNLASVVVVRRKVGVTAGIYGLLQC